MWHTKTSASQIYSVIQLIEKSKKNQSKRNKDKGFSLKNWFIVNSNYIKHDKQLDKPIPSINTVQNDLRLKPTALKCISNNG